jgi:hypothetical protein
MARELLRTKIQVVPPKGFAFANVSDPRRVQEAARKAGDVVQRKHARRMLKRFTQTFLTGGKSVGEVWPKLSPITVRLKGHSRKLREMDVLMRSFQIRRIRGKKPGYAVGFSRGRIHSPSGIALARLASFHEFGTKQRRGRKPMSRVVGGAVVPGYIIPPRPFFMPTVKKYTADEMGPLVPAFFKLWLGELIGRRNIQWLVTVRGA